MIFAIDFDGTCVTHDYPSVGQDIGSVPVLKRMVEKGHQLILFTMRSGNELQDAVDWFADNDLPLYGIQTNPAQSSWTDSPKAYANCYIDDAALGSPVKLDVKLSQRVFVDWKRVETMLEASELI